MFTSTGIYSGCTEVIERCVFFVNFAYYEISIFKLPSVLGLQKANYGEAGSK